MDLSAVLAFLSRIATVLASGALLAAVLMVLLWRLRAQRDQLQEDLARARIDVQFAREARRQADLRIEQAIADANAANRAKSRYLVTVSHELRTPLNSLLGYAQLLGDDPGLPSHRKRAVAVIREAGDHLLNVIDHTLDIARIEAGRLNLDLQPVAFPELIDGLVRLFEMQAIDKGLDFAFQCEDRLPAVVRADGRRLRQVLINILGNALKFTQQGRVSLHLRYARQMAYFEIRDTGPGIPAADQSRIFEAFEQGGGADGPPMAGSGVGLTIARMLTDLMGGRLQLESTPGAGSCFRLKLFLPEQLHAVPTQRSRVRRVLGYRGVRRRLLLIEDEPHDREFLEDLLRPLGFLLSTAASAEEGLALLDSFLPDLLLIDIDLPGMSGWQAIREIRASRFAGLPLAVLTAHGAERPASRPRRPAGTDDPPPEAGKPADAPGVLLAPGNFLQKPLRVEDFLAWLGDTLGLEWIDDPVQEELPVPPASDLSPLRHQVHEGYPRGIEQALDALAARHPEAHVWVAQARALAQRFQFERLLHLIDQAEQTAERAP